MAGSNDDQDASSPPDVQEQDRRQENKERRRRERRERRARRQRQRQNDMIHQMDGYMFEGGCQAAYGGLPDILNSHVPPPPYTTLPGRGHGAISPSRHNSRAGTGGGTWRSAFPRFNRNRWVYISVLLSDLAKC